jgi:serine/threonine protein kinase
MKLLEVDPKKRLTAIEALNTHWINGRATKNENLMSATDNLKALNNIKKSRVNI